MVTHKGASADSGHYIGWARKDGGFEASGEEEWYKFDGELSSQPVGSPGHLPCSGSVVLQAPTDVR